MNKEKETKYSVVPYKVNEKSLLEVVQADDNVWLTQKQIAELFETSKQNIGSHIKKIFNSSELEEISVVKDFFRTAQDGKKYNIKHYNLDVIISVGYRVNSKRGVKFRQWATQVIKERMQEEWAKRNGLNRIENLDQRVAKIENRNSVSEILSHNLYMPIKEISTLVGLHPKSLYRKCKLNQVQYKKVLGNGGPRYEILLLSLSPSLLQNIFGDFAQYLHFPYASVSQENNLITNAKELTADALQGNAEAYQKLNKILQGAAAAYDFEF